MILFFFTILIKHTFYLFISYIKWYFLKTFKMCVTVFLLKVFIQKITISDFSTLVIFYIFKSVS